MFRNLKIGTRLGLAFAVMLILLFVTYYVGMTRLSTMNELMSDINGNNIPETQLAVAMWGIHKDERVEVRNIILITDDATLAKAKAKLEAERQEFDATENALDKMFADSTTTDKEERRLAAKIKELTPAYRANADKVVALGIANKNSEATAVLLSDDYAKTVNELVQTLNDLAAFEDKMNQDDGVVASWVRACAWHPSCVWASSCAAAQSRRT